MPAQFTPNSPDSAPVFSTGVPTVGELNQQLACIEQFYSISHLPIPNAQFESWIQQMVAISDPVQRCAAQQNLLAYLQQMQRSSQHYYPRQFAAPGGFDHRRDYSSSSSASKISSSSSVSSQNKSSRQSNIKMALAQALRDLNNLRTEKERTQFLISKAALFAKDKGGSLLLRNKIDEEVFKASKHGDGSQPAPCQFVEALLSQLVNADKNMHRLMMHQQANYFCQILFRHASKGQLERVLEVIKADFAKIA